MNDSSSAAPRRGRAKAAASAVCVSGYVATGKRSSAIAASLHYAGCARSHSCVSLTGHPCDACVAPLSEGDASVMPDAVAGAVLKSAVIVQKWRAASILGATVLSAEAEVVCRKYFVGGRGQGVFYRAPAARY